MKAKLDITKTDVRENVVVGSTGNTGKIVVSKE